MTQVETSEFPRPGGNCTNGIDTAWSVEARYTFHEPLNLGGQIFDNRWKRVTFNKCAIGVPVRESFSGADRHGLFTYQAAQALRWWLHAEANRDYGLHLCLDSRLIEHRIKYNYSEEAVAAHAYIGGEDRSSLMPNWGVKS